jgi:hypothetical protein
MTNKFLYDSNGKRSSMRLMLSFTVIAVISTWAFVCIWTKTIHPIDPTLGLIVTGAFGAKTWQKHVETKNGQ